MNRILPIAAAAAAVMLFAGTAQAQQRMQGASPWYAELGYTGLNVRDSGFEASPQAIRGIIGYNFHPNLGVEAMAAFGTNSDSDRGVEVKLRNAWGVFAKPRYEFNNVEVFGRLGWVRERTRASGFGITTNDSDSDFAWGVGANYNFNPRMYVGLDYIRYFDKGSSRVNGWTLGLGYRF